MQQTAIRINKLSDEALSVERDGIHSTSQSYSMYFQFTYKFISLNTNYDLNCSTKTRRHTGARDYYIKGENSKSTIIVLFVLNMHLSE